MTTPPTPPPSSSSSSSSSPSASTPAPRPATPVPASAKPVRPTRHLSVGRLVLYVAGVAALAALAGYIFGWYRAYPAEQQRDRAMVRLHLSEARARALAASVAVYRTNWGDAGAHLQEGVRVLDEFKAGEQRWLSSAHSQKVDEASELMRTARELTVQASPDANGRAERAAALLSEVYRETPAP